MNIPYSGLYCHCHFHHWLSMAKNIFFTAGVALIACHKYNSDEYHFAVATYELVLTKFCPDENNYSEKGKSKASVLSQKSRESLLPSQKVGGSF